MKRRQSSGPIAADEARNANNPLAIAIQRGEWERAALLLLLATAAVARAAPPGTVDDLLALLADEPDCDVTR